LALVSVIVSVVTVPGLIVDGEKALPTVRPLKTVRSEENGLVLGRFSAFVIPPARTVLVCIPGVVLVTNTSTTQDAPAANVPLESENDVPPGTAVMTAPAPQFVFVFGGLAMKTLDGKLSVTPRFVKAVSGGAVMLILSRVVPPAAIVGGLKFLLPRAPVPVA
jgi:hypothetical protein